MKLGEMGRGRPSAPYGKMIMTRYDPEKHHRRSIRLPGFDYARPGGYFVTICTHERGCLFGDVVDGQMVLNEYGRVAESSWQSIPRHFSHVRLDAFVVMPNHVHGVIVIRGRGEAFAAKSVSTRKINRIRGTPGIPLWQRNYYEHIIRDEADWNEIRSYISENPLRWELDENHPSRLPAPEPARTSRG